jgi:hypothetical protein
MGRNNQQEIMRYLNAIIDLILKIYPKRAIILIEPNLKALFKRSSMK